PPTPASWADRPVNTVFRYIIEPGFFGSGPVRIALAVGTVIAVTSAVVGVFTVTRGQSFAGHSLADIATTGGSGAFLIGINQFWGYLAFGAGAAAFMELIGIQRRRGRDVATGVVLGAALGLAALFLYLGTQYSTTTGASFTILFGSLFVLTPSKGPVRAEAVAAGIGVAATWLGILLAYDSYYWPPAGRGWPVSFFVVTLITGAYLVSYLRPGGRPVAVPDEPEHACSVALC